MIYVDCKELASALSPMSRIVNNSANSDVHKCVHVTARNKRLLVRGTNLTVFLEKSVAYEGDDEGQWLILFEPFGHYVIKTGEGKLGLDFSKTHLLMVSKTDRDKASAILRDPAEFVWSPKWKDMRIIDCKGDELIQAVVRAAPHVSTSLATPILYCVNLISAEDGSIDVQATDTFHKTYMTVPAEVKAGEVKLLINLPAASEFATVDPPVIAIGYSDTFMGIRTNKGTLYVTLSANAENYPVFRIQDTAGPDMLISVNSRLLSDTLSKSDGFTDTDYRKIRIQIDSRDEAKVTVEGDKGSFSRRMPVTHTKGKGDVNIYVDARHLSSFAHAAKATDVVLGFTKSPPHPVWLRDPDTPSLVYVTWPFSDEVAASEENSE